MTSDVLPGLNETERQTSHVAYEIESAHPLESGDVDELERKAGFRNDGLLEPALRADEDDLVECGARDVFTGDGDGGIDVSPRPASRDHQCLHARLTHLGHLRRQPDCCEKLSSSPTAMRLATSD